MSALCPWWTGREKPIDFFSATYDSALQRMHVCNKSVVMLLW